MKNKVMYPVQCISTGFTARPLQNMRHFKAMIMCTKIKYSSNNLSTIPFCIIFPNKQKL